MSLRTLALAAVGCALVATSHISCLAMYEAERLYPIGVAVFFGGLVAGGGPLALAIFRLWHGGARAWPGTEQAQRLAFVGMLLTVGSSGSCYLMVDRFTWVSLAIFFGAIAFTIGALMLLAWAMAGPEQ